MSDTLSALQEAFAAALAAPPSDPGMSEDDDAADIATPRAKAAACLETALRDRLAWHWDRDEHQGEQLCRVLADMCVWHEHATLRDKVLALQKKGIALLAAVPDGEPASSEVGDIEDAYQAIKPREDDASAIAAALGMSMEEARAFGLVGTLTKVGFADEAPVAMPTTSAAQSQPGEPEAEETLEQLFRREATNSATKVLPAALQSFWRDQRSMDLLITVRRGFHTIKGDARVAAATVPPAVQEELEGLAVLSEAAEDIVDYLLGDDYDPSQPAPLLPPGAFSLMNETARAIAERLDLRRPLDNEVALLKRLMAMQRKAAAQAGVIVDDASLAAKIPLPAPAKDSAAPRLRPASVEYMGEPAAGLPFASPLMPTFLDEATRLMPDLHRALGVLSSNPADEASLLLARRKLHTLKGAAALIGGDAEEIQMIAHHAEDLFELIEDFQLSGEMSEVPAPVLEGVLDAEDALQALLDSLQHAASGRVNRHPAEHVADGLVERLQQITEQVRTGELGRLRDRNATRPLSPLPEPGGTPPAAAAQAIPAAASESAQAPQPTAKIAGLREVSFYDLINQTGQAQTRSRATVIDHATAVEERARAAAAPFSLFVGVQRISQYIQDSARYRDLAGILGQVYVFGEVDETPVQQPRVTIVPLLDGDSLLRERFAVYDEPGQAAAFFACDETEDPQALGRRFLSAAVDDPATIHAAAARLRAALLQDGSSPARRAGLKDAIRPGLAPLSPIAPPAAHRKRTVVVEQAPRRGQDFGKEAGIQDALTALEDLTVARDALQALIAGMAQQRDESRRSGVRLRTLVERVGAELAGLRSELVRTTRRSGEWDLLEKEEFTAVDVLLQQLDEVLADLDESDNSLRRDLGEARAQVEIQAEKALNAQHALLDMSMIPLSQLEDRLAHAVRSQSRRLNKRIGFSLLGGDLVLDGRIAEALLDPMIHLINNALDHGIEAGSEARVAAGKPPEGHLTIRGRSSGDGVAIDVIDDGRGIDPARVVAAAIARGIITADEAAGMSDEERIALIWRPGLSTAAAVTATSGRGIGIKSAQDDVAALNGRIAVRSVLGKGTTFTMILPRSLAMLRVEVVREGTNLVGIPVTQMVATHSVPYAQLQDVGPGQSVQAGDKMLRVLAATLADGPAGDGEAGHATLLEIAARPGAIVVDEVLGSQYLPIRTVPDYLRRQCALLGYAVGGGGHILPILDLPTLIDRSAGVETPPKAEVGHLASEVLVVDDSQTMRRALRDTFAKAGVRVHEAVDGHDALNICGSHMPALITLDMEMPGMDGLDALTALRLLPNGGATVPVFMITSRQQARHRAAALAAGVTRYFTKPFNADDLLSAAQLVLARSQRQVREAAS